MTADPKNPYRDDLDGRVSKLEVQQRDHAHHITNLLHQPKVPRYRLTPSGRVAILLIPFIALMIVTAAVCGYLAWGAKPTPIAGMIATGLIAGIPALGIATGIIAGCADDFWKELK